MRITARGDVGLDAALGTRLSRAPYKNCKTTSTSAFDIPASSFPNCSTRDCLRVNVYTFLRQPQPIAASTSYTRLCIKQPVQNQSVFTSASVVRRPPGAIVVVFWVWQEEEVRILHKTCTLHIVCACLITVVLSPTSCKYIYSNQTSSL